MKSSREIMDSLYERREEYLNRKKRVRNKILKILVCGLVTCSSFFILGMCIWKNYNKDSYESPSKDIHEEYDAENEKIKDSIDTPAPKKNDGSQEEFKDQFPDINTETIPYMFYKMDQTGYSDFDSLIQASEWVFKGKVIKHTYVMKSKESGISVNEEIDMDSEYIMETEYEVEVEKVYKGKEDDKLVLNIPGVPFKFEKDKQIQVMKEAAEILGSDEKINKYLLTYEAWNDLLIIDGEEYLFCLNNDKTGKWITINYGQGVYRLDDPTLKDQWGYLSAEGILSYFE